MPELIDQADSLNSSSLNFVEELYAEYLRDPESVTPDWRAYFQQMAGNGAARQVQIGPSFRPSSMFAPPTPGMLGSDSQRAIPQDGVTAKLSALTKTNGHSQAGGQNGNGAALANRPGQESFDVAILQDRV